MISDLVYIPAVYKHVIQKTVGDEFKFSIDLRTLNPKKLIMEQMSPAFAAYHEKIQFFVVFSRPSFQNQQQTDFLKARYFFAAFTFTYRLALSKNRTNRTLPQSSLCYIFDINRMIWSAYALCRYHELYLDSVSVIQLLTYLSNAPVA